jgi:hypothetical protein
MRLCFQIPCFTLTAKPVKKLFLSVFWLKNIFLSRRLPQKRPFHGQPQYPVLRPDTVYKQPETDKKNQSPMCVEL